MDVVKILKFEVKERLKQPLYWLFFGLMLFQAIWFIEGAYKVYLNEATLMNGAALFYRSFAGGGIVMTIVIAMVTGTALYKDIQYQSAEILYTSPVNDKAFFLGRFLSAYVINLILGFGLFVGMALAPFSGIGSPDKFGPTPWGQMLHGYGLLTASNLFIYTAISISFLVLTRRLSLSYLSIFFITLIFFISETARENTPDPGILSLIDPSGFVYTTTTIDKMPANAQNYTYLTLDYTYLLNRLIWVGGALLALIVAYQKFSFKQFIVVASNKSKRGAGIFESDETIPDYSIFTQVVPKVVIKTKGIEYAKKVIKLASLDFKEVVRTTGFRVLLIVIAILFALKNQIWNESFFVESHHFLTSTVTMTRVPMGVWIMIILMIWSTELLFKDRVLNVWQMKDSLPVPTWTVLTAKFLAMCGVAFLLSCMLMVIAVASQLLNGAHDQIDWSLHLYDFFFYNFGWWTYIQIIAYVFFFAGVTGSRYATHGLSVLYCLFNLISIDLDIIEELRYTYPFVPGIEDYSQLNGYGIWNVASFWYFILWMPLAVLFLLLAIYFWKRGASRDLLNMLTLRGNQLGYVGKSSVILSLALFIYLQSFIVSQVNDLENFEPEKLEQYKAATYEKEYGETAHHPQPKISKVDIELDFFPTRRRVEFAGTMHLINKNDSKVETLYLNIPDFATFESLHWNGKRVEVLWLDKELDYMAIDVAMQKGERGKLQLTGNRHHIGFTQSSDDPQSEVTYNGSFLNLRGDILPVIGYNPVRELLTNRHRLDFNMKRKDSRMNPNTDAKSLWEDIFAPDALWVTGKIVVSTNTEQIAYGPGRLMKTWEENNRNYYEYELEETSPYNWFFGSASFAVRSFEHNKLHTLIYHNPKYTYNLQLYQTALSEAYNFINHQLGTYPYTELRLIEIPYYRGEYFSFPNSIAISEEEGWFAQTKSIAGKSYVVFAAVSQMISHWVFQNISIANVQGADMLRYALPESLALQVVHQLYGDEGVDEVLEKKLAFYQKERGKEPNQEPPLIYADGVSYHYADGVEYLERHKGTVNLYKLSKGIGFEDFNDAVVSWARNLGKQPGVFVNFYQKIMQTKIPVNLSPHEIEVVKKDFEQVL